MAALQKAEKEAAERVKAQKAVEAQLAKAEEE